MRHATQMTAVVTADGALADTSIPVPELRPRDLLIQVVAVSVNPVDTKVRPGDEVYYAGDITRPGANAEYQAVDERIVGRKPATLSFADAAALPLTTITAWETLFDHLNATPDTTGDFLIVGAAGGVGSILTQLARAQTRLRVIGTAGRPGSADWVRRQGAHEIADHRHLAAEVTRLAPDGVDWLFSAYSEGRIPLFAELMRPFGRIVAIDDGHDDLLPLKSKSITWHWEFMFARSSHETKDIASQGDLLDQAAALVDKRILRTTATHRIDGITAATLTEAHGLVENGTTIGKIVLAR